MTAPPADLEVPIGFLLADAQRLMRRRFEREAERAGIGLTAGEARTLAYAAVYPGLRQAALAETMNIDPMTLVAHLDALETKGLVMRAVDPTDRRAKRIHVTAGAAPTVQEIREIGALVRDLATRGLAEAEVAMVRRVLVHFVTNLSEAEATG